MKKNKKIKKTASQDKTYSFKNRKTFIIISIALIVVSTVSFAVWHKVTVKTIKTDSISLEDKIKLGNFGLMIGSYPDDFKTVYNGFWDILDKYNAKSEFQIKVLKEDMSALFYLPKLFYEDAEISIKKKKPFKSAEREKLEKHFYEAGFLTKEQIQNDMETMELISKKKPIAAEHGIEIFIDETRINEMLRGWDDKDVKKAINKLFTP